jgi:hypothetical protein
MMKYYRNLSEQVKEKLFVAGSLGMSSTFVVSLSLAIVGGLSGNVVLLGIGLGLACAITLAGVVIRERNIAGY